jgi:hypothetical protein
VLRPPKGLSWVSRGSFLPLSTMVFFCVFSFLFVPMTKDLIVIMNNVICGIKAIISKS